MNAKEAMIDGGDLTIRTQNQLITQDNRRDFSSDLKPGRYALVSVQDEGAGMTPDTLQRLFDPFFTTKCQSENSGLGLSMVQGFMKQSGGAVTTQSAPGQGTTFHLYFPTAED
jgi:signal transduction histidine kinase